MVGQIGKIILVGKLTLNGVVMSLDLLKNLKITTITTNHQGIHSEYESVYELWPSKQDILL